MTPLFINRSGQRVPKSFLTKWIKVMTALAARRLPQHQFNNKELVLVFLDEGEAKKLNHEYRGRNYATDVLSFASGEADSLGELVLSPTVLARQARDNQWLVRHEMGYMILHGFLHLLGYDHEKSRKAAKEMFDLQDSLFEEILYRVDKPKKER